MTVDPDEPDIETDEEPAQPDEDVDADEEPDGEPDPAFGELTLTPV
jgi:hypothetical protein